MSRGVPVSMIFVGSSIAGTVEDYIYKLVPSVIEYLLQYGYRPCNEVGLCHGTTQDAAA